VTSWSCDELTEFQLSSRRSVRRRCIPQGSVLGPLLFLIYINDLLDTCGSYSEVYAFADGAKFFRHILTDDDRNNLQCAVNALQNWSRKWLLNLNVKKCQVVSFGRHVDKVYTYNTVLVTATAT